MIIIDERLMYYYEKRQFLSEILIEIVFYITYELNDSTI